MYKQDVKVQLYLKSGVELQLYRKRHGDDRTSMHNYIVNGILTDNRSPATGLPTAKS